MKIIYTLASFFILIFIAGFMAQKRLKPPEEEHKKDEQELRVEVSPYYTEKVKVEKNTTFYGLMRVRKISKQNVLKMIKIAKPFFDLAKMPLGSDLDIIKTRDDHEVVQVRLYLLEDEVLLFRKKNKTWTVRKIKQSWDIVKKVYRGYVNQSLWESLLSEGLDDKAVFDFIRIFSWQIDFKRQSRSGDMWRILIEVKQRDGKFLGWRNIIYAEYRKRDKTPFHAVRFPEQAKSAQYFSLDGDNLAGLFLKSPVNFTRISSKFRRKRFHPILKIQRPHYGIDYAAARGTPVYSVGDGVIKKASYSRGSGNFLVVKHNHIYETAYRHLHGFAKKIKKNKKVKQGEIIGYVGSTGLATGPHLHFEFLKNSKHIDPLSTSFPRASSIAFSEKEDFRKTVLASQQEMTLLSQKVE